MADELSRKASIGAIWVVATIIFGRGIWYVSSIILARILYPSDFGILSIMMGVVTFALLTTTTGFNSAIIQKKEGTDELLDLAWTIELIKNLCISVIIYFSAPFIARFFNEQRIVSIVRASTLIFVFIGLRNIGVIYFRKYLDFKKHFVFEIIPYLIYPFVSIPIAYKYQSVWALVIGQISIYFVSAVLSYVVHPYRPKLDFHFIKARELFHFGKWIFGNSLLIFFRDQGINLFVGKVIGIKQLGYYERANYFSIKIFQQLIDAVWRIGYPLLSYIQNEKNRFRNAVSQLMQLLIMCVLPAIALMILLAEDVVVLILTDKWIPIINILKIMCFVSFVNVLSAPGELTFQAMGKPSIAMKLSLVNTILFLALIYPLSRIWGVEGVAIAILISNVLVLPVNLIIAGRMLSTNVKEYISHFMVMLINTMCMALTVILIKKYVFYHQSMLNIGLVVATGISAYLLTTYIIDKLFCRGRYLRLIRNRLEAFV